MLSDRGSVSGDGTNFLRAVFAWMFFGLLLSAASAFFVLASPGLQAFVINAYVILAIIELVLVVVLSWLINKIPTPVAMLLFVVYSLVSGVTLLAIVLAYTETSVAMVFLITSGMFGAMSVYGFVTKRDLSGLGAMLFMALVGIILASIVNIFLNNAVIDLLTSIVGVIIFTGLTAYDVQRIRRIGIDAGGDSKYAIVGALALYLDFINLFISLLRLFGKRRD